MRIRNPISLYCLIIKSYLTSSWRNLEVNIRNPQRNAVKKMQRVWDELSSKNRRALAITIFEMQEWNSCDTHREWAIGILYSPTWRQLDVKNISFVKVDLKIAEILFLRLNNHSHSIEFLDYWNFVKI